MVTQAQWKAVMGFVPEVKTIGSRVMRLPEKESRDRPVTVSWYEAMDFCARLNESNLAPAGYRFTLPTETQWEYAARGGSKSRRYRYSGSDDLNEVAWTGDAESTIYPVAKKKPNELGLYDMSGNEREWCLDDYDSHEDSSKVIPEFSRGSEFSYADRACRGGNSMGDGSKTCRPGRRDGYTSYERRIFGIAFRVALASTALPEHPQYAEERRRAEEYRRNCVSGDFVVELPGNVKLGMVKVEPGTFEMGAGAEGLKSSGSSSAFRFFYFDKDVKPHPVTLTHDYYIGKTVVTQEQWKAVMKKEPHGDSKRKSEKNCEICKKNNGPLLSNGAA